MPSMQSDLELIGGLSNPSKMPCHSWSTPAELCPVGSLLRDVEGSTCKGCYALKGTYVFPVVRLAMARRMEALNHALTVPAFYREFAHAFARVLNAKAENTARRVSRGGKITNDGSHFRWHDSGDIQSVAHLELIVLIADLTPLVMHWLPTREAAIVKQYQKAHPEGFPSNLTVRMSLQMVNQRPPKAVLDMGLPISGVHDTTAPEFGADCEVVQKACSAYSNNGECGECRACWLPSEPFISYPKH